jgi:hypothetical protein
MCERRLQPSGGGGGTRDSPALRPSQGRKGRPARYNANALLWYGLMKNHAQHTVMAELERPQVKVAQCPN